jgi:uncharacterized membrane protein YecN with MAPEG domain
MLLAVTGFYAALLGLVAIALTVMTGRVRIGTTISLGAGSDDRLLEAMRRHANWVENVPFILLLIAIAEIDGAAKWWIHVLGATLLIARIVHPFGIKAGTMRTMPRFIGMLGTLLVAFGAIVTVLWQSISRLF